MSAKSATVVAELATSPAVARPRLNRAMVLFSFLSIYLIWGSTYLAIRYAVETIPPLYTAGIRHLDRKSTRLNSSHVAISYAVFCLKKKTKQKTTITIN